MKTSIEKENYKPIIQFGCNKYILCYNPVENENNDIVYEEDTIIISKNTKEALVQAIIDNKYSASKVNIILSNHLNNINDNEYNDYIAWLSYAEKCAKLIFGENTLQEAISDKIVEIIKYDESSAVNGFYYQGNEYWLDKATRVGLMNSTRILKESGQTSTTLWFNNMCLTLPVDDVIDKLSALEQYALSCYNVTASHKIAVQALTTIDEVNQYDVTQGYPTKLDLS